MGSVVMARGSYRIGTYDGQGAGRASGNIGHGFIMSRRHVYSEFLCVRYGALGFGFLLGP